MTPAERKERSEKILREKGIEVNDALPMIEPASQVNMRSLDAICRRALSAIISTQIGCAIGAEDTDQVRYFIGLIQHYGLELNLNPKEMLLINGKFTGTDVTEVIWEYEDFWAIAWAMGLVDDITDANEICDVEAAVRLVSSCQTLEEFKNKCHPRDIDEILDMLDLYFRYSWAVVRKDTVDPDGPTGGLNGQVVFERRRGLEWLFSNTDNWFDLTLAT